MAIYGTPPYQLGDDQTDRIGIRTLVVSKLWQASRGNLSILELDAESPPPPAVPSGLYYLARQTKRQPGCLRTYWTFEGVFGNGKDVTFRTRANSLDYEFTAGFAQVAIELHPSFAKLKEDFGGVIQDGQVIWPATVGAASGAGGSGSRLGAGGAGKKNPLFGIQDFLRMEGTYTFRYAAFSIGGINNGASKIFTSAGLPGGPPPTTDGRNWLKAPSIYRRRGPVYDITESYWMSGPGGWPIEIYGSYSGGRISNGDAAGNPSSSRDIGAQGAGNTGGVYGGGVGFSQGGVAGSTVNADGLFGNQYGGGGDLPDGLSYA